VGEKGTEVQRLGETSSLLEKEIEKKPADFHRGQIKTVSEACPSGSVRWKGGRGRTKVCDSEKKKERTEVQLRPTAEGGRLV